MRLVVSLAVVLSLDAQVNVLTWHNDNARTGQNLNETILTPATVDSSTFGKLFVIPVDGKVDAQPLYVPSVAVPNKGTHNVLYVVTEHDSAYAFDADDGTPLWHVSLLNSGESTSDDRSCGQVTPEIGITSTPVIDVRIGSHGVMYVVSMSKDASGSYHQRLHALDLITGGEQLGGPVEVQASYPGAGNFDGKQYKERAALLIANGIVYTSWASHCDIPPYTGWVIGYDESTLQRVTVMNLTPNGSEGSIWASGAGPAADASGTIYLMTANGTFDTTLDSSGMPSRGDFGNAFVKLTPSGTALSVTDYFTMSNTVSESAADEDLGSGGLILLPSLQDAQGNAHDLTVGAGKDGNMYVVDRNNMGHFRKDSNSIYQDLQGALGGVFSTPAWFNGSLYYASVGGRLMQFVFRNGVFVESPTSQSATTFPYPGATPSISASGNSNGIAWVAENSNPAVLHAYDAADLSKELYNSNQAANGRDHFGTGNKYIVPTVANGKVYVATTNGIGVFGLIAGFQFVPVTPCRMADTRSATGPFGGPALIGGTGRTYAVPASACNIPATAVAYSLNITAVPPGPLSYLSVWPAGQPQPFVSTLNSFDGRVVANAAIVPAGTQGAVSLYASDTTDVVIDINGYFAPSKTPGSLSFYSLTPCRIADTRSAAGQLGGPFISGGSARNFPIASSPCLGSNTAQAYALNITVVPHQPLEYLATWPSGQAQPFVSTLNSSDGSVVANAAIVPAGSNGAISVFATGDTDVIIDINGYFAPPGSPAARSLYTVSPCRVVDTRGGFSAPFGPPSLPLGGSRSFPIPTGACAGIPASVQAYSLNVTVVPNGPLSYLTAWPTGLPQPVVSTVNSPAGKVVANAAIVRAGTNGAITVFVTNPTDLILDINAYFAP
ncbi:MAG TPA: hypothetical protein VKU01_36595 [Bryobacteraceae bacterium]|nr:hypothetical protein [Bryobacteraceae bacterium]